MLVNEKPFQSIWPHPNRKDCVQIIDQRQLPFHFVVEDLETLEDACVAIRDMHVRGAPLIGVTAAWGIYLGVLNAEASGTLDEPLLSSMLQQLIDTRPTAVNLR